MTRPRYRRALPPQDQARRRKLQGEGRAAFIAGKGMEPTPYPNGSREGFWWEEGWMLERQLRDELKRIGGAA